MHCRWISPDGAGRRRSPDRTLRAGAAGVPPSVFVIGAHDQLTVLDERVLVGHDPHGAVPNLGFAPTVVFPAQLLEECVKALEVVDVPAVDLGVGTAVAGRIPGGLLRRYGLAYMPETCSE